MRYVTILAALLAITAAARGQDQARSARCSCGIDCPCDPCRDGNCLVALGAKAGGFKISPGFQIAPALSDQPTYEQQLQRAQAEHKTLLVFVNCAVRKGSGNYLVASVKTLNGSGSPLIAVIRPGASGQPIWAASLRFDASANVLESTADPFHSDFRWQR